MKVNLKGCNWKHYVALPISVTVYFLVWLYGKLTDCDLIVEYKEKGFNDNQTDNS